MIKKLPDPGTPWFNESRHDTFEDADHRRTVLLEEQGKDLQVKVKKAFGSSSKSPGKDAFVVKARKLPKQKEEKKTKKKRSSAKKS
tara:strand:+ start:2753 stop:3010 length:258 start_codon:yes stop_codon:yes gene_type:complete